MAPDDGPGLTRPGPLPGSDVGAQRGSRGTEAPVCSKEGGSSVQGPSGGTQLGPAQVRWEDQPADPVDRSVGGVPTGNLEVPSLSTPLDRTPRSVAGAKRRRREDRGQPPPELWAVWETRSVFQAARGQPGAERRVVQGDGGQAVVGRRRSEATTGAQRPAVHRLSTGAGSRGTVHSSLPGDRGSRRVTERIAASSYGAPRARSTAAEMCSLPKSRRAAHWL